MIRLGTKKIIPFYEDYKPVEVRRNNVRIAGWVEESKSGEHVDFEQTYNHYADVLVHGNSMQDGIPTPDVPIPVLSVEGNLLVNGQQSIALPILRKIGDIVDTYNPKTGEYVQRIGVKVFDGTEAVTFNSYPIRKDLFYTNGNGALSNMWYYAGTQTPSMCSHFKYATSTGTYPTGGHLLGKYAKVMYIMTPNNYETTDDLKSWLAAQYAAGTPVTVYYPLAEPVTTYFDPAPVPTYYPYTRLEQDGAVKGVIEATVKVME